ncbi:MULTISPECIES: hypothetical protein [Symbiopectobacterium]|uniref:hypothetical protein n=1 Tax=Symbiopectobacterium TaxID=801 RepID=UPI0020795074|nr:MULTISPECIES: hypothetical protein [Symbiopectobacterium]
MLALIGVLTIATLLFFIMTKRMSPMVALIVIPIAGALLAGSSTDTAKYVVDGITKLAPMAAMFVFAICFSASLPTQVCLILLFAASYAW